MIKTELERVLPGDIEKRSFEIITEELGDRVLDPENELVIKRVIHTTADFDYADSLIFSEHAVELAKAAIKEGVRFITDTNMGKSGVNRAALQKCGCTVDCFMADEDVAEAAKRSEPPEPAPVWRRRPIWAETVSLQSAMPLRHWSGCTS